MPSRIIKSYGGSERLTDALSSLLVMEALQPSQQIHIISPWISNSFIIDNSNNKFSGLFPFVTGNEIGLIDFIEFCAWKGSQIKIISRMDSKETKNFYQEVKDKVEFRRLKKDHEKGFVTENFYLHGSMNFTYSGVHINGEKIRITTEKPEINQALLSFKSMWEDAEKL